MSHGHSGHDSCLESDFGALLHFGKRDVARGVTDVDVGSGALFGEKRFGQR